MGTLQEVTIPKFKIRLDPPRQSSDEQSLHVFVSWQNPHGYDDSDIYGYESPVAYPIRCMIPEDSLSQPRVVSYYLFVRSSNVSEGILKILINLM